MNQSLLDCTLEEIDSVARNVQHDVDKKINYFEVTVNRKEKSEDLLNEVQKYIHMVELYHLNIQHGTSSEESDYEDLKMLSMSKINSQLSSAISEDMGSPDTITIRKILEGSSYEGFSRLN